MSLVVQKYGGSSLADADSIKRVARGSSRPSKAGNDVVRRRVRHGRHDRRAARPRPAGQPAAARPRAGHAADRRRADLDGPGGHGDRQPGPRGALVHRLAGRRDHRLLARPRPHHRRDARADPGRARRGARSPSSPASRASARTPRTSPRSAAAAPTRPPSRWPRRSRPTSARSTPTSTASSPPTRGSCPSARKIDRLSNEEMLEMAACGAKILHLRCVEYARRYDMPIHVRSSFSYRRGHLGHRPGHHRRRAGAPWKHAIIAGVAHDRSEAKITVVGVPDQPGKAAEIFQALRRRRDQHRHDRAERLRRRDRPDRHLVHLPKTDGADRRGRRSSGSRSDVGFDVAAVRRPHRQALAGRRGHAVATPASPRRSSRRSPTPASTSR